MPGLQLSTAAMPLKRILSGPPRPGRTVMQILKIGTVPYLNAVPLTEGLAERRDVQLVAEPPSRLAGLLEQGQLDVAMLPAVDYLQKTDSWPMACPYGITADGPVQTVRIFAHRPLEQVQEVFLDSESHCSVALTSVLFRHWLHRPARLTVRRFDPAGADVGDWLLIGDKAMTGIDRPFVCDLGQFWRDRTGLPFVFALWVARDRASAERAGPILAETAEANASRIDELASKHAARHGFEVAAAHRYLGQTIRYRLGERERAGLELFGRLHASTGAQVL